MNDDKEKGYSSPQSGLDALESPFFSEALFINETEWDTRRVELELERLFRDTSSAYHPPVLQQEDRELQFFEKSEQDEVSQDENDEYEQSLTESFLPFDLPKRFLGVADALNKKDWPLALKLAIEAGQRDENQLTNLIFFARHTELPPGPLDPKGPNFKQLSEEWVKILNGDVWKAIEASAENRDLVVSGKEVSDHHRRFFRGKSGRRLRNLVQAAATKADLNPGLLGTIMMAETRRPQSYLSSDRASSYHIGTDDFYEARSAIKARVPAYASVKWDKSQKPEEHYNDAKKNPRIVKTIYFDSGPDAVLATAVYAKFYEVRLREIARELKGDFDTLPLPIRLALTRMAMAAGAKGATPFLKDALEGRDIFVREPIPVKAYQTKRNATVRTAQAMHLSDWVFGNPLPSATVQPEMETFNQFDAEADGFEELENHYYSREFLEDLSRVKAPDSEDIDPEFELAEGENKLPRELEEWAGLEDQQQLEFDEFEAAIDSSIEEETADALSQKLRNLSIFPHTVEVNGKDVALTPTVIDPGIYDGPAKYKVASQLQECLMEVMNKSEFSHINVALVDLTKDVTKPEFAGYNHKRQVFAASVPKVAAMLAAFQLRHDLRALLNTKGSKSVDELFAHAHDHWSATQPSLPPSQTKKITTPQLKNIFAQANPGSQVMLDFKSTGENKDQLRSIIDEFKLAKKRFDADQQRTAGIRRKFAEAKEKIDSVGFVEKLRIMMGGLVPASNYATSKVVGEVGFSYIASTLIQSGLYDIQRKGGLWLGADYAGTVWQGAPGGGSAQSATTGSASVLMVLLAQNRLVSPQDCSEMLALIKKEPNPTHPGIASWFKEGLLGLKDQGLLKQVFSKVGVLDGVDDCTLIKRKVELGNSTKELTYVAVGLRARNSKALMRLILQLDKCILANNGLTPVQGGHS
jgi:hypothetical protein